MITQETGEDMSSPVIVSDEGGAVSIHFGGPPAITSTGEAESAAEPLPSILHRFHNLVGMEPLTVSLTWHGLNYSVNKKRKYKR